MGAYRKRELFIPQIFQTLIFPVYFEIRGEVCFRVSGILKGFSGLSLITFFFSQNFSPTGKAKVRCGGGLYFFPFIGEEINDKPI